MTNKVKLTMPGTETVVYGKLTGETIQGWYIQPDGASGSNAFAKTDGWQIEHIVELPTKQGAIIRNENGVVFIRRPSDPAYPWLAISSLNVFTDAHMRSSGNGVLPKIEVLFEGIDD